MRFFTSDTHFGHTNIIKYCNRPFKDVPHMNSEIVRRWNTVVGSDDVVFHLGDVALGPWEDWKNWLPQLNGHKILVVGNHEKIFPGENNARRIERFRPEYERYFEQIVDNLTGLELDDGSVVNLSHFPYEADHMEKARFMDYRLADEGRTLIHGHTHLDQIVSRSNAGTLQIHVGMDAWDYTPVSEDQVINLIHNL